MVKEIISIFGDSTLFTQMLDKCSVNTLLKHRCDKMCIRDRLKGQIAELQELEQKSQSTFEQFKADDLVRYQSEIDALNRKREQLQAAAAQQNTQRQQTLEQLRRRIQNLTASIECGTLSPADSERLAECKASLEDCRVQLLSLIHI